MADEEQKKKLAEYTKSLLDTANEPKTDMISHIDAIIAGRKGVPDSAKAPESKPSNKKVSKPEPKDTRRWTTY